MKRAVLLGVVTAGLVFLGAPDVANAQIADVVISKAYGGGAFLANGPKYDLVELFNRTGAPISLVGWSVQVGLNTAGTSWAVVPLTGTIPAHGHYLVRTGDAFNGGALGYELAYDDSASPLLGVSVFTSPNGRCALVRTTTALTACTQPGTLGVEDLLGWGTSGSCYEGAPAPAGNTSGTTPTVPARKQGGCQDTGSNAADFELVTGPTFMNSSSPAGAVCPGSAVVCCRGSACAVVAASACTLAPGSQAGMFAAGPGGACNAAGNDTQPCCKADYTKAGGVELLDIFAFLQDWFNGVVYADFTGASGVDLLDIFAFLQAWFNGGC